MNSAVDKTSHSHIFVSYCHENDSERDRVLLRLQEAKLPYWYDESIEAGNKWKPQIDNALQESFALIVVVTPEAMKSTYVTYEWSWALGSSIPVFPLLLNGTYDIVHSRLLDEHCVDCREVISNSVIQQLEDHKETPPDTQYLNDLIRNMVSPLRVSIKLLTWCSSRVTKKSSDRVIVDYLFHFTAKQAEKLSKVDLPSLLIDKSHAFSIKQKRSTRAILNNTRSISVNLGILELMDRSNPDIQYGYDEDQAIDWLTKFYEQEWLPTFELLDEKHNMAGFLDAYLDNVEETPEEEEEDRNQLAKQYSHIPPQELHRLAFSPEAIDYKKQLERNFAHSVIALALNNDQYADTIFDIISRLREKSQ